MELSDLPMSDEYHRMKPKELWERLEAKLASGVSWHADSTIALRSALRRKCEDYDMMMSAAIGHRWVREVVVPMSEEMNRRCPCPLAGKGKWPKTCPKCGGTMWQDDSPVCFSCFTSRPDAPAGYRHESEWRPPKADENYLSEYLLVGQAIRCLVDMKDPRWILSKIEKVTASQAHQISHEAMLLRTDDHARRIEELEKRQ